MVKRDPPRREKPVNPPGFLATQDLKERGWTPALIARFLGEHDQTRPNGLKMGRRRLPPVKLYREERVLEVEREDSFLAAQARAADARERAERTRAARLARREAALQAAAESFVPGIQPEPLRKGAVHKARQPYLPQLEQVQQHLEGQLRAELGRVSASESARLRQLLGERLDWALAAAYPWFPAPGEGKVPQKARDSAANTTARPSDWREWDWD